VANHKNPGKKGAAQAFARAAPLFGSRAPIGDEFQLIPIVIIVMAPVPIAIMVPAMMIIPVVIFLRTVVSTMFMFFDFTPGCNQQTGQAK
jgi:hypothetical protein